MMNLLQGTFAVIFPIVFIVLLLPGIILAALPSMPGLLYMLAISALFAWIDGFVHVTSYNLLVLAALVGIGFAIDVTAGIAGAKIGGAHWKSLGIGGIGLIIGTLLIPIPLIGSFMGLFLGILGAEWYRTRDIVRARRAAVGGFAGSVVGVVANTLIAIVFFFMFIAYIII